MKHTNTYIKDMQPNKTLWAEHIHVNHVWYLYIQQMEISLSCLLKKYIIFQPNFYMLRKLGPIQNHLIFQIKTN